LLLLLGAHHIFHVSRVRVKDSVGFDWIRLTGFYFHIQRIEGGTVRGAQEFPFLGDVRGRINL